MTEEEIARFELVLREADRIRQEIAFDETLHGTGEGSPKQALYGLESQNDALLLAA